MPKTVEITEEELLGQRQIVQFVEAGLNNPKTRRKFLEIQRELNPNAAIPELDAAAPIETEIGKLREELAAEKKAREDSEAKRIEDAKMDKIRAEWNQGRAMARDSGYTDEGIEAISKYMEEKGILDWEVGLAAFERKNPPPAPSSPIGHNSFDVFNPPAADENTFMKSMMDSKGDNESALSQEVSSVLRDIRGIR